MKRLIVSTIATALLVFASLGVTPVSQAQSSCFKIQSGTILDSANNPITLGYDQFGYNYQAHMFNGTYNSSDRNLSNGYWGDTTGDYVDDALIMKWSDAWLSNLDCDGDQKLDRGGNGTAGESKGWCTNQVEGDYMGSDSESHHYTYFCKIVYVGPVTQPDPWSATRLWGTFAVVEEIFNDPFGESHGVNRANLVRPGLGLNFSQ